MARQLFTHGGLVVGQGVHRIVALQQADFDGDEVQVYLVSELLSKEECKAWS